MKYYYCSFNYWQSLEKDIKSNYFPLVTARTLPKNFQDEYIQFEEFTPSWSLFKEACQHFTLSNFETRYSKQIYALNKENILQKLNQISINHNNKTIVFLVWEDDKKSSERDIFMPWLSGLPLSDIKIFSLNSFLLSNKNEKNILFDL